MLRSVLLVAVMGAVLALAQTTAPEQFYPSIFAVTDSTASGFDVRRVDGTPIVIVTQNYNYVNTKRAKISAFNTTGAVVPLWNFTSDACSSFSKTVEVYHDVPGQSGQPIVVAHCSTYSSSGPTPFVALSAITGATLWFSDQALSVYDFVGGHGIVAAIVSNTIVGFHLANGSTAWTTSCNNAYWYPTAFPHRANLNDQEYVRRFASPNSGFVVSCSGLYTVLSIINGSTLVTTAYSTSSFQSAVAATDHFNHSMPGASPSPFIALAFTRSSGDTVYVSVIDVYQRAEVWSHSQVDTSVTNIYRINALAIRVSPADGSTTCYVQTTRTIYAVSAAPGGPAQLLFARPAAPVVSGASSSSTTFLVGLSFWGSESIIVTDSNGYVTLIDATIGAAVWTSSQSVYSCYGGNGMYAFSITTTPPSAPGANDSPTVALVVGCQSNSYSYFQAMGPSDGKVQWYSYIPGGSQALPAVFESGITVFPGTPSTLFVTLSSSTWTVTSPQNNYLTTPLFVNGITYLVYPSQLQHNYVEAVRQDGFTLWRTQIQAGTVQGQLEPFVFHGWIMVPVNGVMLAVIDQLTGAQVTTVYMSDECTVSGALSSVVVTEKSAFFATNSIANPCLMRMDTILHVVSLPLRVPAWASTNGNVASTQIVVNDDFIHVSSQYALYVISRSTMKQLWTYPLYNTGAFAAGANAVFIQSKIATVNAVESATGKLLWIYNAPQQLTQTPILYGDVLLLPTYLAGVIALNTDVDLAVVGKTRLRWMQQLPSTSSSFNQMYTSDFAVTGNIALLSTASMLAAFSVASGLPLWNTTQATYCSLGGLTNLLSPYNLIFASCNSPGFAMINPYTGNIVVSFGINSASAAGWEGFVFLNHYSAVSGTDLTSVFASMPLIVLPADPAPAALNIPANWVQPTSPPTAAPSLPVLAGVFPLATTSVSLTIDSCQMGTVGGVVVGDIVVTYCASNSDTGGTDFIARRIDSSQLLWHIRIASSGSAGSTIYAVALPNMAAAFIIPSGLFAINVTSGRVMWNDTIDDFFTGPLVVPSRNALVVGWAWTQLAAYDLQTGAVTQLPIAIGPMEGSHDSITSVFYDAAQDLVVVSVTTWSPSTKGQYIAAIRGATLQQAWNMSKQNLNTVLCRVSGSNFYSVFIPNRTSTIVRIITAATGAIAASYAVPLGSASQDIFSAASVTGDFNPANPALVTSVLMTSWEVIAIQGSTILWRFGDRGTSTTFYNTPLILAPFDLVILRTSSKIAAVRLSTGLNIWNVSLSSSSSTTTSSFSALPLQQSTFAFFIGAIIAVDVSSGTVQWQYAPNYLPSAAYLGVARGQPAVIATTHCPIYNYNACPVLVAIPIQQSPAFAAEGGSSAIVGDQTGLSITGIVSSLSSYSMAQQQYIDYLIFTDTTGAIKWHNFVGMLYSLLWVFNDNQLLFASDLQTTIDIYSTANGALVASKLLNELCIGVNTRSVTLPASLSPNERFNRASLPTDVMAMVGDTCLVRYNSALNTFSSTYLDPGHQAYQFYAVRPDVIVVVSPSTTSLIALNATTLTVMWTTSLPVSFYAAGVTADPSATTIFVTEMNIVVAVSVLTGTVAWRYALPPSAPPIVPQQPTSTTNLVNPVLYNNSLLVFDATLGLIRLDVGLTTGNTTFGRVLFMTPPPVSAYSPSVSFVMSSKAVYPIGVWASYSIVYAIDVSTGAYLWNVSGFTSMSTLVIEGDIVIATDYYTIVMLDLFTGTRRGAIASPYSYGTVKLVGRAPNATVVWGGSGTTYVNVIPPAVFSTPAPPAPSRASFVPYVLPAGWSAPPIPSTSVPNTYALTPSAPHPTQVVVAPLPTGAFSTGASFSLTGFTVVSTAVTSNNPTSALAGVNMATRTQAWILPMVCGGSVANAIAGVFPWSSTLTAYYCSSSPGRLNFVNSATGDNTTVASITLPRGTTFSGQAASFYTNSMTAAQYTSGSGVTVSCSTIHSTAVSSTSTGVACFDTSTRTQLFTYMCPSVSFSSYAQTPSLAVSPSQVLIVACYQGPVVGLNAGTGQQVWIVPSPYGSRYVTLAFDPTFRYFARSALSSSEMTMGVVARLYESATGRLVGAYMNSTFTALSTSSISYPVITVESSGTIFLVASTAYVVVATRFNPLQPNTTTITALWHLTTPFQYSTTIASDSSGNIYTAGMNSVKRLDSQTGEVLWSIPVSNANQFTDVIQVDATRLLFTAAFFLMLVDTSSRSVIWQTAQSRFLLMPQLIGTTDIAAVTYGGSVVWIGVQANAWQYRCNSYNSLTATTGTTTYVGHTATLVAVEDASPWQQLWSVTLPNASPYSLTVPPIVAGDFVVATSTNYVANVLHRVNGSVLSSQLLPTCGGSPVTSASASVQGAAGGSTVVFITGLTCIFTLDLSRASANNPPLLQTINTAYAVTVPPLFVSIGGVSALVFIDAYDIVYATTTSGTQLWNVSLPYTADNSFVTKYGNFIYAADLNSITCIELATGRIIWVESGLQAVVESPPIGYNGALFVVSSDGVHKIRIDFGAGSSRIEWTSELAAIAAGVNNGNVYVGVEPTPVITQYGILLAMCDDTLFAVNATNGAVLWYRTDCSSPQIVGVALVATCGVVEILDWLTGESRVLLVPTTGTVSTGNDFIAVASYSFVTGISLSGLASAPSLPTIPLQPEPTFTVPPNFTPQPTTQLPTPLPSGFYIPDLQCVATIQQQTAEFNRCVNNLVARAYSGATSPTSPISCTIVSEGIETCRNFYLGSTALLQCPLVLSYLQSSLDAVRASTALGLCGRQQRCSEGSQQLVCDALSIPSQWTAAPGGPSLIPGFTVSVAPLVVTYSPAAPWATSSPTQPTPSPPSPPADGLHASSAVIGAAAAAGGVVVLVLIAAAFRVLRSRSRAANWRHEDLEQSMVVPSEMM